MPSRPLSSHKSSSSPRDNRNAFRLAFFAATLLLGLLISAYPALSVPADLAISEPFGGVWEDIETSGLSLSRREEEGMDDGQTQRLVGRQLKKTSTQTKKTKKTTKKAVKTTKKAVKTTKKRRTTTKRKKTTKRATSTTVKASVKTWTVKIVKSIGENRFDPKDITVNTGDRVTWLFPGNNMFPHSVVEWNQVNNYEDCQIPKPNPRFDSGWIQEMTDKRFTVTFGTGYRNSTVHYICNYDNHCQYGMVGSVTVK